MKKKQNLEIQKLIYCIFIILIMFTLFITSCAQPQHSDNTQTKKKDKGDRESKKLIIEGFNFLDIIELEDAGENLNIEKVDSYSISESISRAPGDTLLGDVNSDGNINIIDALLTAQYYVGKNPEGFNPDAADVDENGIINIVDALIIAQYYVGLIAGFC